jgi:hypothetical protein
LSPNTVRAKLKPAVGSTKLASNLLLYSDIAAQAGVRHADRAVGQDQSGQVFVETQEIELPDKVRRRPLLRVSALDRTLVAIWRIAQQVKAFVNARPNPNHKRVARPGDREFYGALEAKAARRAATGALRLRATKAQNPGAFSI